MSIFSLAVLKQRSGNATKIHKNKKAPVFPPGLSET
jgi:hypothetical protein